VLPICDSVVVAKSSRRTAGIASDDAFLEEVK
jgi:hypothetical protein